MKRKLTILFLLAAKFAISQDVVSNISTQVSQQEVETHIRFLASDELLGRDTGSPGIDIAAAYMAAYFEANNIKTLPGMDSYYQSITFYKSKVSSENRLKIGDREIPIESFASSFAEGVKVDTDIVFADYGRNEDLKKVREKVVLLMAGEENGTFEEAMSPEKINQKLKRAEEAGATAVIFMWHYKDLPWDRLYGWINRDGLTIESPSSENLPHFYIDATDTEVANVLKKASRIELDYKGRDIVQVQSKNVIGFIEGTEDKDKYLLLSAHYDHIGGEFSDNGEDKIFNGARDNAVGTSAILMASEYFSYNRPKTSVIFALWTAEEKGLLGSRYFSENPPIELNKIYYNLNIDGAGYNDTTKVTVVGLDRTKASEALSQSASAFGLTAITDPAPEQNLFDRSDNVNFARKGIPAPTYSLGFTAFDQEIGKYYHNVADEAATVNFNYITQYTRSYILAASKIANRETETFWMPGDKYEAEGKNLYGLE